MNLLKAIKENDICIVESIIKQELSKNPKNITLLFKLCLTELQFPFEDYVSALECIENIYTLSPNNIDALILESGIKWHSFGYIEKELFDRLGNAKTCELRKMAIITYLRSFYYHYEGDVDKEKALLERTIQLFPHFVYPYESLARIFKAELEFEKSKIMYKKAIENIEKILKKEDFYDFTDIETYVAEYITGVAISEINYARLCQLAR